jgi:two-component system sensor kinase
MSIAPSKNPVPIPDPALRAPGQRIIGARYQVLRALKSGHETETLLASDLAHETHVVIKTAAAESFSATARMRLEHEAHVLATLKNEPIFPPLIDFGSEGNQLYLVMPFVPGITLQTRLRQGPLSVPETIALGNTLLTALAEAHAHRILHRDVKPANVIVDAGIPFRNATLIDFGLARSASLDTSLRGQWVGTAQYLSPEGAGLLDEEVTECSDLYSVGIVLYECLAGRPPFEGKTVGEVLRQHMTVQPIELRRLGLSVPRVLDEVIQRLMRKDPRDRYQSARAVVADLTVIAEALQRGESEPALVVGLHDRRRTLTEPAFVGRGQELETLSAQLERTRAGQGGLVLLEAESGGGKTRLLVEFALRAAQQGVWVLRGQGVDQAAPHPFQLLTGVAEGLLATVGLEPGIEENIRTALGDQQDAVCSALPELAKLFGAHEVSKLGPETFAETRSVQALAALLDALGATGRPVLVLLDDCQWADQATLKVLSYRQRRPTNTEPSVLLVAAFRSEEVPASHLLRTLQPVAHLTLPAFQAADVRKLVESMAGPLPNEAVKEIERLAEGSPFMVSAALRGLVESGALVANADGWRVERSAMAGVQSSRHAAALLARRIELLPPAAVKLLSVGAVLGKEFDLFTAAKLAGQPAADAIDALHEAKHRQIVWAKAKDDQCAFVHDKLRETLLDRLPEAERKDLHLRAALDLEASAPQQVFDLAYHFDAAGENQRAFPYALAAAEQARTQHSLEIAEEQYRIAERGAPTDRAVRYRVAEGLGDVLMLRGRYAEAAQQTQTAGELAVGEVAKAQIDGKLGELAFKQGDMKTAIEDIERALERLGHRVPQWSGGFFLQMAREAVGQVFHSLLPSLFVNRKKREGAETQLLLIRLLNRLTYNYWFKRGKIPCLWAHLRGMNLAERYPPTLELAQAYSIHAPVMSLVAYFDRGVAYAEKSFAIYKALGDLWGQGQSHNFHGIVLYTASRYEEAIQKLHESVRLLERTGDYWEVNIARVHIANSLYRLGRLPAAIAEARRIHQAGLELGDIQATGICLDVWAMASGGQVNPELLQTELRRPREDAQVTSQVIFAEGVRFFYQERMAEAADLFEKSYQVAAEAGVVNAWIVPHRSWLASALRRQAEKSDDLTPARRQKLLKHARRVINKAVKVARTFRNDLPHALREAALIAAMQGNIPQARKHLDESLAIAERQNAKFEHAQTLLARGRIGLEMGWPNAQEEIDSARQELRALGADFALDETAPAETKEKPVTLSLADRFDTVLDAGRRIASALSRQTIFKEVREAAALLLRGERCLLLEYHGDEAAQSLTTASGEIESEYSRAMAQRALATGRVVVFAERDAEMAGEAALLAGVRSGLCAPIFVRGRPVACFYVDHRQVRNLFGEDEQRLAEFIATLAGAALENAEGFAELQRLNETLEQRVTERTAALEKANRAKSEFLANMSHEIRTPMNHIMGMTELALQTRLTPQQHDYLNIVLQSADSLLRLLNDILDFSKVEAGKLELETIEFRLRDTLGDALHALGIRAAEKKLELAYLVPPDVPDALLGDPGRLRQIIVNLVGNALKFTDQGEVVVAVTVEDHDEEHVHLHFVVSDTGIGIPVDKQRQIFEAFTQADTSTTRRYGGTGLGLTISMQLVKLMGGRLWVESEVGQGSTFHFDLHFGLLQEVAANAWTRPESLQNMPVLIVDDNKTNRRVLQDVLANWGMQPILAADGEKALTILAAAADRGEPIRLALLDVMMPGMDGFQLAERIRQDERLASCTLLLLSSAGLMEDPTRCSDLGIARYLIKPVKQSDLRDALLRALGAPFDARRAPGLLPGAYPVDAAPLRILLAEDGLVNQQVACRLLEVRGHRVTVANNGREALILLERDKFDLVLMDMQMPEMDGFEATAAIRLREKTTGGHIPIIAMTANAMKGDRERCLAAGMDGYLAKPIRSKDLYETVEAITPTVPRTEEIPAEAARSDEPVGNGVLDWKVAVQRVGGRSDLLKKMVQVFLEESAKLMPVIRQAIDQGDGPTLRRVAHSLKGSADCFAAEAAVAAALRLEMMGRNGTLTNADEAYLVLQTQIERLERALAEYR